MINMLRSLKNTFKAGRDDVFPVMDLVSYQSIYRDYPKPSDEQIKDFVEFVCGAKSWYKHLALLPPGVPFHFYFDQYAGWKRIKKFGGEVKLTEYKEGDERLHYSHIPTNEYRERFGWLAFSCERGTRMYRWTFKGVQDSNQIYPIVYTSDSQTYRIPKEVIQAGGIFLTAPIHYHTAKYCLSYISHAEHMFTEIGTGEWPVESGGREVWNEILEMGKIFREKHAALEEFYSKFIDSMGDKFKGVSDSKFDEMKRLFNEQRAVADRVDLDFRSPMVEKIEKLIAPEQSRLRQKMFLTIKNVCKLLYE